MRQLALLLLLTPSLAFADAGALSKDNLRTVGLASLSSGYGVALMMFGLDMFADGRIDELLGGERGSRGRPSSIYEHSELFLVPIAGPILARNANPRDDPYWYYAMTGAQIAGATIFFISFFAEDDPPPIVFAPISNGENTGFALSGRF